MNGRAPSLFLLGLTAAGCSGLGGDGSDTAGQRPVVIPLTGVDGQTGPEQNLNAYYRSVFGQLKAAYRDRDSQTLRHLLGQHQRSDLPAHITRLLEQFEVLAGGVEFERALGKRSRILLVEPARPLSESQRFRLVLTGESDGPVIELGGRRSQLPCSFLCTLKIKEHGVLGERREYRTSKVLPVEHLYRLSANSSLTLQFEAPASTGEVAIREVHLMMELLTCKVRIAGRPTPIRRTTCGTMVSRAYPPNHGPIQRAPLKTMGEALRRGSRKYFRHVVLAAHFMPAEDAEQAMVLLVRKLRVGTKDQARVAMVGLQILSGQDLGVTDRQIWLRWWERHKTNKIKKPDEHRPGADKR